MDGVRGRQIIGQDDDVVGDFRKLVMGNALQVCLHSIGDILHVDDALAKVFVVETLEPRLQLLLHLRQRPLGVDLLGLDLLDDLVGK